MSISSNVYFCCCLFRFQFAAVQFSSTVHKVFDFNDYAAGRALDKLMKDKHLKSLTRTHRALEFVL